MAFGYGTNGLTVTHVTAVNNGAYGISRFASTRTLFARDIAIGSHEAGFYVGDGHQINSGGIVVLSARQLTHGHNPKDILVTRNTVRRNRPFDLRWDGTGKHMRFARNRCATSSPAGFCH